MHDSRGFTLIELMVTLAIIAIISMMAAPSFSGFIANKKLDLAARDLAGVFAENRAKATALRRNVTVQLQCTTAPAISCANTATTYYWSPPNSDITLQGNATAIVFTAVGLAQRSKQVSNPDHATDNTQPETITIDDLTFVLCNTKLGESREVKITKIGTVDKIVTGTCS